MARTALIVVDMLNNYEHADAEQLTRNVERVGSKLDDAHKAYSDARNRLSDSRQAVIPRARRLVALGARGKRRVSEELLPELEEIAVVVDGESLQLVPGDG